jgi:CRP-like cAMP-binding protein
MTIEDDIAFLERVPLLRRLGGGALRSLAIAAEPQTIRAGEVLFTAGQPSDGGFVVQHGSFSLKPERAGEAVVIVEPGTLLGESSLLAETKRPATATAREDSTVLRLPRATFLKILDSYPDAAQRLREMIAARTTQWARDMENIRAALNRDKGPPQ